MSVYNDTARRHQDNPASHQWDCKCLALYLFAASKLTESFTLRWGLVDLVCG